MSAPPVPFWKKPAFYIQLIALLFLAFGLAVAPTLFSSAPAHDTPLGEVLLTIGVIALIVFGLVRLVPRLSKGLTVLLVIGALIVPGIIIGLGVVLWGEQASDRWDVSSALRKALDRDHVENLAAFFEKPSGPTGGLKLQPEDVERIKQYAVTLPSQVLKEHRVVEHLLRGIEIRPTDSQSSLLTDETLEALCRLYVDLKERSGFSPDSNPLDLRQRARMASRVAELGMMRWRQEVRGEHPIFAQLFPFYTSTMEKLFPKPLAPGERVFSQTLGSFPLFMLMQSDELAPPRPRESPPEDPYGFVREGRRELREQLSLMKSRGIDFTEEELRDERLQAVLKGLQEE